MILNDLLMFPLRSSTEPINRRKPLITLKKPIVGRPLETKPLVAKELRISADHMSIVARPLIGESSLGRLWAINRQAPESDVDYENAADLALYWYYNKYLACSYSTTIENRLKELGLMT